MRDPARIKILLAALEKHWNKAPDQRLFQLLENLIPCQIMCNYCCGQGHKVLQDKANSKPLHVVLEVCLRCQGLGQISVSNYNVEDDLLIEKLRALEEKDNEPGPVS